MAKKIHEVEIGGTLFTTDKNKKDDMNTIYEPNKSALIRMAVGMWKVITVPLFYLGQWLFATDVSRKDREKVIKANIKKK